MTLHRILVMASPITMAFSLAACGGGSSGSGAASAPIAVASATPTPAPAPTPTPTSIPTPTASPSIIIGTDGNDVLNGTDGIDAIEGRGGDDTISGFGGNDSLNGGNGSDTVRGGAGEDRLIGSQFASSGVDTLFGDGGADVFQFDAHTTTRILGFVPGISATLSDFQTGFDKLELRLTGISFNDPSPHWLENQPFTGQNRLEVRLVDGVLQIDDDGDRVPELMLRVTGTIVASDLAVGLDAFGF